MRPVLGLAVLLLSSCAHIDSYCDNPQHIRDALRDTANASQNTVVIKDVCADDN